MSAPGADMTAGASIGGEPTMAELLAMATDVVAMLDGRVEGVDVGSLGVSVHVACQGDAEFLAWRLGLGQVCEHPPSRRRRGDGFTVWTDGDWSVVPVTVFCNTELVRPVRAFPRQTPHSMPAPAHPGGVA